MLPNYLAELESLKRQNLYRQLKTVESLGPTQAVINNKKVTVFASNDYLGLSQHPKVKQAAILAVEKYGSSAAASRLISGNHSLYQKLEKALAEFKNKPAALVFPTGYMANVGLLSSLAIPGSVFFFDRLNHASLYDGWLLSRATLNRYDHHNLEHLEKQLKKVTAKHKFIVTDTVFSMDGDLAPLAELQDLAKTYDCCLIGDDAHGTGVLGPEGRGASAYLGVKLEIEIGTLSKALGALGGFVAADQPLIEYLINKSRPFIFTTGLPPAIVASSLAALKVLKKEPWRQQRVLALAKKIRLELTRAGYFIPTSFTPIIPIIVGDEEKALALAALCLKKGIFVPAIRTPAVPKSQARLRLTVSAAHSDTDIETAIQILIEAGKELRLIA